MSTNEKTLLSQPTSAVRNMLGKEQDPQDLGHTSDECMHLKRQIEEMLKAGKLSHLIKELKQSSRKDQAKATKKGETSGKKKPLAILMNNREAKSKENPGSAVYSSHNAKIPSGRTFGHVAGMSGSKPFLEVPSSARATSVAGLPKSCGSCSFPSMFLTADVGWLRRVCSLVLMMSILGNAVVFATPRMMPACLYKKCYGLRKVDLSAHATSTLVGDLAEVNAVKKLVCVARPEEKHTAMSFDHLTSFQEDAKYEHVGQDIRFQGGKDDQDKQGKDLKILELKTNSKDNDNGSRSKITQHEGTSLQHNKDQRLKNLTTKQS
nr:retrotransposon Gag domain-containing protein [Tanacetum cinerariifolium]